VKSNNEKLHYSLGFVKASKNFRTQGYDIRISIKYSDTVEEVCSEIKKLGIKTYCNKYFNTVNLFLGRDAMHSNSEQDVDSLLKSGLLDSEGIPTSKNKIDTIAFIRGMYEFNRMFGEEDTTSIRLTDSQLKFIESIVESKPIFEGGNTYRWPEHEKLDFLTTLYRNSGFHDKYTYKEYSVARINISNIKSYNAKFSFEFAKTREDAVNPFKARASDSGFDITLLEKSGNIGKVEMYSTGIIVKPDLGWYFILAPRSSIIKSGYILANGVGIIDRSYRGEIKVPLIKIDESMPDLELPSRLVQLVPTPIVDFDFQEKEIGHLGKSGRGEKGFGSSGLR